MDISDRDHYPVIVYNKQKIIIRTLNIRKTSSKRLSVNILSVYKTQRASNGDFISDTHRIIHAAGEKNERGERLILDNDICKCVLEYCQISGRILLVKLKQKPFNIAIIIVYTHRQCSM